MTVCVVGALLLADTRIGIGVLLTVLDSEVLLLLRARLGVLVVVVLTLAELGSSGIIPSDTILGFEFWLMELEVEFSLFLFKVELLEVGLAGVGLVELMAFAVASEN